MVQSESPVQTAGDTRNVNELQAQAALFNLVGRIIEQEVDEVFLGLLRGELKELLDGLGVDPGDDFYTADESELVEILAEEYTGLCVAPGCVSPYLSVFETGALYREPCDQVYQAYREAGPDHIGTMLAFVGYLYEQEARSLVEGDIHAVQRYSGQRQRFLLELLGPWAPGWCRRASQAALHPFYQQMLSLTERLLWLELSQLVDRRELKELAELNRREPEKMDYDADFRKASGI